MFNQNIASNADRHYACAVHYPHLSYNYNLNMQKVEQSSSSRSLQIRFKLIKLLSIDIEQYLLPFFQLQLVLQILFLTQTLKFSIDYFPQYWFITHQPVFLYLDLSYYFNLLPASVFIGICVLIVVLINLYWIVPLAIQLYRIQRNNFFNNVMKVVFLIFKNVLLMPIVNTVLNLFNCYRPSNNFRTCFQPFSILFIVVTLLSFLAFMAFMVGQLYLDFEFIRREKVKTRIKRSGVSNAVVTVYAIINEINAYFFDGGAQLAILNLTTLGLLIILVLLKDEVSEKIKLMQYSFVATQLLAVLFLNLYYIVTPPLPTFLFPLLAPFLFLAVMQLKTTSLRFQLSNINKWPTPEIMISYARKLRDYLALRDQYNYVVYIHGYMEIHRQKCDNPACPSRCALSEHDRKLFQTGELKRNSEQLLRCENIIKKIYSDGYKLTPISPELQLQNSLFLYERRDKELSLRNLLAIKLDRLSLDKIYRHNFMKEKIHRQLNMRSNKFLDLVSEMDAKKQEEEIFQRFEKAALINLEFWSLLNDDHPDFQKMNQVGLARIRIREEIRENYSKICSIAHSERVTAFYANYLESIQNDEHMFNEIYEAIKKKFGLDEKITLQDWANSSSNIMLVSIEEATFGKIVDVNTSCATTLGYQKFQLVNQSLKNLFLDQLKNEIKDFSSEKTNGLEFYMTHKSGYLVRVIKHSQNYNSMETGMTSILNIEVVLTPGICSLILDRNGKIMGVTSSVVPLLGLDIRIFQSEIHSSHFFAISSKELQKLAAEKETAYPLSMLLNKQFYEVESKGQSHFRIKISQFLQHTTVELQEINRAKRSGRGKSSLFNDFQFQAQATPTSFKYVGMSRSLISTVLSPFTHINYIESALQNQNSFSLQKGITTLRLRNNVIQIIEEVEQVDLDHQYAMNGENNSEQMILPRKDQQEIFQSKDSFEKFIQDYRIAAYALILMGVGLLGVIGLQTGFYAVYSAHNSSNIQYSDEIAFQNLVNGAVAKEYALIQGLQLAAMNLSAQTGQLFQSLYLDNMKELERIELLGSQPFPLSMTIEQSASNILSRQFLITLINYANQFTSSLKNTSSAAQMWSSFTQMNSYVQTFLTTGTKEIATQMNTYILNRQSSIISILTSDLSTQNVMISMALLYLLIFSLIISFVVHRINSQRIDIFEIFLEISDTKIQQFSNRTERLLVSLHIQEANEDMDEDPDKKISSNIFSKKKSFKQVTFGKEIYMKIIIIPLFFVGYFIHSYVVSASSLDFQITALPYFRLTATADMEIYTKYAEISSAILASNSQFDGFHMGTKLREYYRMYNNLHYDSFGEVDQFHQAWTDIFYLDICPGLMSPLGNTTIAESCLISDISDNGTFVIISNLITIIQSQDFTQPLPLTYIYKIEAISKAHRLITAFLIKAQQNLITSFSNSLLEILLIWLLCGLALILFWGIPVTRSFIQQINQIKNIISILPISLAKELPNARKYFHKILKQEKC